MDLFVLDMLVISLAKRLISDSVCQISTLIGLWLVSEMAVSYEKRKVQK